MNIIYNSEHVEPLDIKNLKQCHDIYNHFNRGNKIIEKNVYIDETIHGHIMIINRVELNKNTPYRFNAKDIEFLAKIKGLRWFDGTNSIIHIAFKNKI